ncbi:MAG: hypothetical protein JNJ61_26815 [Anaerolineae bacterium]|nr:hypothetical protein [Anaerolineae bacterium]
METSSWIYYRLFSKSANFNDIEVVLKSIVAPVIEQFSDSIQHVHFFNYSGAYGNHLEGDGGVIKQIENITDEQYVWFIRLRLRVASEREQEIRKAILAKSENSPHVLGIEEPVTPYDVIKDLGRRFGNQRIELVMNLLESSARLAIDFAKQQEPYNPHPDGQGGSSGLVHLVSNTLQYNYTLGNDTSIIRWEWGKIYVCDFPANVNLL